jgi:hypothetical protein
VDVSREQSQDHKKEERMNETKYGRFVVVPVTRYSVREEQSGTEVLQCGTESLAEFWAERLAEIEGDGGLKFSTTNRERG